MREKEEEGQTRLEGRGPTDQKVECASQFLGYGQGLSDQGDLGASGSPFWSRVGPAQGRCVVLFKGGWLEMLMSWALLLHFVLRRRDIAWSSGRGLECFHWLFAWG